MAIAGRRWRGGVWGQIAVRALSALALVVLSLAHQPVLARQIAPEMTAEYTLPDGSIADICFGQDGVEGKGHRSRHEGLAPVCDYCRLAASVLLLPPADSGYLVRHLASSVTVLPDLQPVFVDYPRLLPQSRAPPVTL